jgi:hypothetical protein
VDRQDWVEIAKRRVVNVLRRRRFASNRQLEKKISEAGPGDQRPEPMKVSTAITQLLGEGRLLPHAVPQLATFYSPSDFGGQSDEARRDEIIRLATEFRGLTRNQQACGKALERVVYTATRQAGIYTVLGTPDHPPAQGFAINGYVLEKECDHILIPKELSSTKLVVEDKNLREWLHPSAEEVWGVIGKALRIPHATPVLICRRMHYVGFPFFRRLGMMCWQVYNQFFSPDHVTEAQLEPYRNRDLLGFADITRDLTPPDPLIHFFASTIPANIDDFAERFESNRVLLTEFAITKRMDSNIPTPERNRLYGEFFARLPVVNE